MPSAVTQCSRKAPPSCLVTCPLFISGLLLSLALTAPSAIPTTIEVTITHGAVSKKRDFKALGRYASAPNTIKRECKMNNIFLSKDSPTTNTSIKFVNRITS